MSRISPPRPFARNVVPEVEARGLGTVNSRQVVCWGVALSGLAIALDGCGEGLANLTASLGGGIAGQRGVVGVVLINNTPYRAVLTMGSFNQTDPSSPPDFRQFSLMDAATVLDGNTASDILSIRCARVFAIGSPRLLERIESHVASDEVDEEALVPGIDFFEVPAKEPGEGEASDGAILQVQDSATRIGSAPSFEALLGVDFPCGALLIFRQENEDTGTGLFRLEFELIPSQTTR